MHEPTALPSWREVAAPRRSPSRPGCLLVFLVVVAEYFARDGDDESPWRRAVAGGLGMRPSPDLPRYAQRIYGLETGLSRVVRDLGRLGLEFSLALDCASARHLGRSKSAEVARSADGLLCAGEDAEASGRLYQGLADEHDYVRRSVNTVQNLTARRVTGWISPSWAPSLTTAEAVAKTGLTSLFDLVLGDECAAVDTPSGRVLAVPRNPGCDDVTVMCDWGMEPREYASILSTGAATLASERADDTAEGVLCITIHTWLSGRPAIWAEVLTALESIRETRGVEFTGADTLVGTPQIRTAERADAPHGGE